MEYAYRADLWQTLYATLASATAALTGLLFIALSLIYAPLPKHQPISRVPGRR